MADQRCELRFFFVVALGGIWALQLPVVLAKHGILTGTVESYLPLALLGGFSPLVAAVLASRRESGWRGVRELFASLVPTRTRAGWYTLALLLFPGIYVAGIALYRALGGTGDARWLYLPENPQHVVALFLVPLTEEPGWRGYALPRLQRRFGKLRASFVLGGLWAAWHTMMFLFGTPSGPGFALAMANIVAGSLLFSWLHNRSGGSLLVAVVAHLGVHLNNPAHATGGSMLPLGVYTLAIATVGFASILLDRHAWRDQPG
jgi:membrane protease YdiL (CAAX protease family)